MSSDPRTGDAPRVNHFSWCNGQHEGDCTLEKAGGRTQRASEAVPEPAKRELLDAAVHFTDTMRDADSSPDDLRSAMYRLAVAGQALPSPNEAGSEWRPCPAVQGVLRGDFRALNEAVASAETQRTNEARRCHACDQVRDDVGELPDSLPLCKQCAKAHRMGYRCGEEAAALAQRPEPTTVSCGHPVEAQYKGADGWRCGACPEPPVPEGKILVSLKDYGDLCWNLDGVSGALIDAGTVTVHDDDYSKSIRELTAQRDALAQRGEAPPVPLCFHAAKGERCTRYLEGSEGARKAIVAWLRNQERPLFRSRLSLADELESGAWRRAKTSKGGTNMRAAGESPARVEEQSSALPGNCSDDQDHPKRAAVTGLGLTPKGPSASSPPPDPCRERAQSDTYTRAELNAALEGMRVTTTDEVTDDVIAKVSEFLLARSRELAPHDAADELETAALDLRDGEWRRVRTASSTGKDPR